MPFSGCRRIGSAELGLHGLITMSDKNLERDDDSMKSHRAPSPDAPWEPGDASRTAALGGMGAAAVDELNQPLGAIALDAEASLQWLTRENPNVAEAIEAIQHILRDVQRASRIAQGIRRLVANSTKHMTDECG
jgi:signal transduction histidine kinase